MISNETGKAFGARARRGSVQRKPLEREHAAAKRGERSAAMKMKEGVMEL